MACSRMVHPPESWMTSVTCTPHKLQAVAFRNRTLSLSALARRTQVAALIRGRLVSRVKYTSPDASWRGHVSAQSCLCA